ncbi:MAG: sulfate reduction electron transfer complex DsrMKJOP subunit DsrM [Coriobacteriales bacterium]|jgi:nitrate reductase gamma subunit|nr:sulfate reduction electron transfer complex DsrMKJOP subunit DsrM [Coriobacteriales bacterium]
MKIWFPLLAVGTLALMAWVGAELLQWHALLGIIIPYSALVIFAIGFAYRVILWGRSAVPFRITTTCGQQKTLPWIKQDRLENPSTYLGVIGRMLLEVFLFRSLFRNAKTEKQGSRLGFGSAKWLWLGGLAFHWSLLIILLRHLRLFLEPVPAGIQILDAGDAFFQIGIPLLYLTDIIVVCALSYLFLRRVVVARIRYISLPADYFALFLLLGVVVTGILMRYWFKVDMFAVKEMTLGLASLHPTVADGVGSVFYIHLFLVSVLFAYFPWSKLMHAGGVFLSPTRNLANNSRAVRHENPWNYPVTVHSYAEYEDEFREKMEKVGLPLERSE